MWECGIRSRSTTAWCLALRRSSVRGCPHRPESRRCQRLRAAWSVTLLGCDGAAVMGLQRTRQPHRFWLLPCLPSREALTVHILKSALGTPGTDGGKPPYVAAYSADLFSLRFQLWLCLGLNLRRTVERPASHSETPRRLLGWHTVVSPGPARPADPTWKLQLNLVTQELVCLRDLKGAGKAGVPMHRSCRQLVLGAPSPPHKGQGKRAGRLSAIWAGPGPPG